MSHNIYSQVWFVRGYTFIELLVIMIVLSILVAYGTKFIGLTTTGADRMVTIIDMRNIANALDVIKNTNTIPNIQQSGVIADLNGLQTLITFPEKNRFDEDYHYTLTPTIKVSSTIGQDSHPLGFLAVDVVSRANSSDLTVHYRAKIHQKKLVRLAWIKQFYYNDINNTASLTLRQTNQGAFVANNVLGDF